MEDDQKKSSLDRVNDLYSSYQNARALYSLARKAATAGRAVAALAATSEIWVPILIVLGIVLIFTFLIVLGGQGQASQGTTQNPSAQPVTSDFSTLFKTTNNGDGISDPDFYNLLKDALSNPTYSKLITTGGVFNVEFFPSLDNFVGCQALVQGNTIKFYGLSLCNIPNQKYLASHEAGHVVENRNARLYQSFPHSDLVQQDPGCYSSLGFLKSYFYAESGAGTNPFEESFAEAIALYLMPNERKPLTNFQNQCPNTYNWIRDNIFK